MGKKDITITFEKKGPLLLKVNLPFVPNTPGFKFERYTLYHYSTIIQELNRYRNTDKKSNPAMAKNWENLRALIKASEPYSPRLYSIFYSNEPEKVVTMYLDFENELKLQNYTEEIQKKFKEELKY